MQSMAIKTGTRSSTSQPIEGHQLIAVQLIYWTLAIATIIVFIIALPVYFTQLQTIVENPAANTFETAAADADALAQWGISIRAYATLLSGISIIRAIPFVVVGFLIYFRKPADRMTIITSLTLIVLGLFADPTRPVAMALVTLDQFWYFPVNFLYGMTAMMVYLFFSTFPTGTFFPRWVKWANLIWLVVVAQVLIPNNPFNIQNWALPALLLVEIAFFSINPYSMYQRYKHGSNKTQQQQSKWVMFGISVLIAGTLLFPVLMLMIFPQSANPGLAHAIVTIANRLVSLIGMFVLLLALTFSILRYRLWEIEILINRSIVYGLITAVLVLIFVASIIVIQQVFQLITGLMFSSIALVMSALISGSLLHPIQKKLRYLVNHHIYHFAIDPDQIQAQKTKTVAAPALDRKSLGQYQIMDSIGQGGMGEVYRAWQASLNRPVAIKVLARHLLNASEYRTRFEREAQAAASLKHPNIIQVYDLDYSEDIAFMVMEYIEGQNLLEYIKAEDEIPLDIAISFINQIADALDFTHARGFVHRDIKPSNIMLRQQDTHPDLQAVLMDFGVARLVNAGTRVTGSGLLGTLDYAAPEQIAEAHEVDHRADIYALAVMSFQILTGKLPFASDNLSQVLFAQMYRPAPDIRDYRPDLPEDLALAIMRAMAKDPDDRYNSAGDFADAINLSLEEEEDYLKLA